MTALSPLQKCARPSMTALCTQRRHTPRPQSQEPVARIKSSLLPKWFKPSPWSRNAARFQDRVWQRIAREEAQTSIRPWTLFSNWLSQFLARPSLAVSYLVLLLFTGLLAGYWQAHVEQTHTLEQLGSRYVQMMDPYQT